MLKLSSAGKGRPVGGAAAVAKRGPAPPPHAHSPSPTPVRYSIRDAAAPHGGRARVATATITQRCNRFLVTITQR